MYSLKNLAEQEPANIVGVFMLGLNLLVVVNVIILTAVQLAAVNGFLIPFFHLFYIRPLTTSKSALKELREKSVAAKPGKV